MASVTERSPWRLDRLRFEAMKVVSHDSTAPVVRARHSDKRTWPPAGSVQARDRLAAARAARALLVAVAARVTTRGRHLADRARAGDPHEGAGAAMHVTDDATLGGVAVMTRTARVLPGCHEHRLHPDASNCQVTSESKPTRESVGPQAWSPFADGKEAAAKSPVRRCASISSPSKTTTPRGDSSALS